MPNALEGSRFVGNDSHESGNRRLPGRTPVASNIAGHLGLETTANSFLSLKTQLFSDPVSLDPLS